MNPPAPRLRPNAALALLALSVVLSMSPWFSAAAALPQLREGWGLNAFQGSWLTLAVQLGFVAGAVVSAALNLADRTQPRVLIAAGALTAALANAALLLGPGLVGALLARAAVGAALALVYPPALRAMSAYFTRGRGLALGVMVGALTLGSASPHLVNALGGADWRVVVGVTSALAALGGLLALPVPPGPLATKAPPFRPAQAWRVLTARGPALATLGYLGHMWELYAMWTWFALFYGGVLSGAGAPDATRGAALATFSVVGLGALGCVVGGVLGDRWGRTRLTELAMWLSGGAALVLAALVVGGASPGAVLAVSLFWGFWIIADSAQFSTVVSEIAPGEYVGTALTAQLALGFTLTAVTIALVPLLLPHLGWGGLFTLWALGPLLGALAMRALRATPDAARIADGRG
ncbi:nitrate/nitrite transporter [Deinococcus grandis]|uniref:Nitrate/nitrite transporter n=1 Tax=Deinococcus grandis TaxID=57498 RepID=A0A100HMA9_9DEIO|nr:MFS transporter [Deinococcus grandis]BBN94417.1 MFS transporter [Deinococcus grandis]GAQ22084.1 nitrate/nitrite transporter [Deinococcus grandis]